MAAKKKPAVIGEKKSDMALAVSLLAAAMARLADSASALVNPLVRRPDAVTPSPMERFVVAAEKQADARLRIAATLEAEEQRHAREAEADEKRAAERHAADLKAAADHVATVRGFFARVEAGEVRVTSTGPSGGPEVAFGRTPAAAAPEAAPFPSQAYEGGTATPIVAVSTPAEPASTQA